MLTSIGDLPPAPPGTRIAYSRGEFQFGELRVPSVSVATPNATEATLVAAAKLGDRSAFLELWTRYSNMAYKTAYRIMRNRDDAEDVIQEAWMKAYVHLNTFDGRAKFSTWLTRITINSALMILRRRNTRAETPIVDISGCFGRQSRSMTVEPCRIS